MKQFSIFVSLLATCLFSIAQERSLTFNDVSIIEIAPSGNVWVGSFSGGCAGFTASSQMWAMFTTANTVMKSDSVTCIALYGINGVPHSFMGSANGIGYKHGATWDTIAGLPNRYVIDMIKSPDHVFYVATPNGISAYNDTALTHTADYTTSNSGLPSSNITCFQSKPLACNGFYAGTADTGYFYSADAVNYTHYTTANSQLLDNRVNCLYVESNCSGKTYVGTKGGMSVCTGITCNNFTDANGLPENDVSVIEIAPDGHKWIGTRDSGIAVYNDTVFQYYTTANGLPSNRITDIKCNTSCDCWVGTADAGAFIISCSGQVSAIPTNLNEIAGNNLEVAVYPNPTSDQLHIRINNLQENALLTLTDFAGRVVKTIPLVSYDSSVDISELAQGLYVSRIVLSDKSFVIGKIMVW